MNTISSKPVEQRISVDNTGRIEIDVFSPMYGNTKAIGAISKEGQLSGNGLFDCASGEIHKVTFEEAYFIQSLKGSPYTAVWAPDPSVIYSGDPIKVRVHQMEVDGNSLVLPEHIHFDNYQEVKKVMHNFEGKYKSHPARFVFPFPAQAVKNLILSGRVENFKKHYQYFATPPQVAKLMLNEIIGYPSTVLEPSAGQGALVDAILEYRPNCKVIALELSPLNVEILKSKYANEERVTVIEQDFLSWDCEDLNLDFDLVLANPPFTKKQDIKHIRKMWELLANAGQLITLSSNSWTYFEDKESIEFREWAIEQEDLLHKPLPNGSFRQSGTDTVVNLLYGYK